MRALARLILLLAILAAAPAVAQDLDATLARLAAPRFDEVQRGVEELAASGFSRAPAIIEALGQGRLLVRAADRALFLAQPDGTLLVAATGEAAGDVDQAALKPVKLNNKLRRAVAAALGGLTLMSPDPRRRLEAAEAVFRSRDVAALPALETALAQETDPAAGRAFAEARAAVLLNMTEVDEAERLAAVATLAGRGDPEAAALLRSLPPSTPDAVRAAALDAIAAIERRQRVLELVANVAQGISLGSVLLLAAIGLAITFGVMGVINMAHGEMVMLGAYTTYAVQLAFKAWAPGALGASLLVAVPAAFLTAGAVGVAIERGIIRFLYGRPLETLLATWGLSLVLQQAVRSLFGSSNREVVTPSWMSGTLEVTAGLSLTWNRTVIVLFALAVFAALLLAIRRTAFGLEMRAVTQNRRMAGAMGIRTPWVDAMTFGLGSGIAGIAGVALAQIDNVSPNLGQSYIIDSFMVVVFGGVGNLWGTLTAAMTLGIVNKFLEPVAGAVLGKILVLAALIIFIQKRPRGLFALRGRAAES
jgi:urea transport system permease protein